MKELDIVKLIKIYNDLPVGTVGTIVHKYTNNFFEVEFVDSNNDTIDVVMVESKEIELLIEYI